MTPLKIGIRKSPFLGTFADSILKHGDTFTSTNDTGADFYLAWGWPQAEQVARDNGGRHERIICVDAHPFALRKGDTSGARILQLGNWGALAKYPDWRRPVERVPNRAVATGPALVLGQVYTAIQKASGFVDVWHTGGYEIWAERECSQANRKFRKHPRVWAFENEGEIQPSLEEDLTGCSQVLSWNSTAAIHALMLGYPASAFEPHGWALMPLDRLAGQQMTPADLKSGTAWERYRAWLLEQI